MVELGCKKSDATMRVNAVVATRNRSGTNSEKVDFLLNRTQKLCDAANY